MKYIAVAFAVSISFCFSMLWHLNYKKAKSSAKEMLHIGSGWEL